MRSLTNIEIVSKEPLALKNIEEQTQEMCLIAVKKFGWTLQWVKHQTEDICIAAVSTNGLAIQCVREQTPKICDAAVKSNFWALKYVQNQTDELCNVAVRGDYRTLALVNNPTEELCVVAIKQNPLAIFIVDFNKFDIERLKAKACVKEKTLQPEKSSLLSGISINASESTIDGVNNVKL